MFLNKSSIQLSWVEERWLNGKKKVVVQSLVVPGFNQRD